MKPFGDTSGGYRLEARNPSGDVVWVLMKCEDIASFDVEGIEDAEAMDKATAYLQRAGFSPENGIPGIEWKKPSAVLASFYPSVKQPPEFTYEVYAIRPGQENELVLETEDLQKALAGAETIPDGVSYQMVYDTKGRFVAIRTPRKR